MAHPVTRSVSMDSLVSRAGPQGQMFATVVSSGLCGSKSLGVGYVTMKGRLHTHAHRHINSDIVVTVVSGIAATVYGEELQHVAIHHPGDSIFIPAGVLHAAVNLSDEVVHAVEVRTDCDFADEDVVPFPDLDLVVGAIADRLQKQFVTGTPVG
ncbi:cupin domain-containing protein [Lentzea sp. NPDC004782]|uniref:cupin domain-containing protein n=1 Tax=Lentzea sp. NPDC004782 TaxID=3154458 RepID=UPI00339F7A39